MADASTREPDATIKAARTGWVGRMVAAGVPLSDFQEVAYSIDSYDDWCRAWSERASMHEKFGRAALLEKRPLHAPLVRCGGLVRVVEVGQQLARCAWGNVESDARRSLAKRTASRDVGHQIRTEVIRNRSLVYPGITRDVLTGTRYIPLRNTAQATSWNRGPFSITSATTSPPIR